MSAKPRLSALTYERDRNRALMPNVTAFVDDMKKAFGADQVIVRYASENGIERGKREIAA